MLRLVVVRAGARRHSGRFPNGAVATPQAFRPLADLRILGIEPAVNGVLKHLDFRLDIVVTRGCRNAERRA